MTCLTPTLTFVPPAAGGGSVPCTHGRRQGGHTTEYTSFPLRAGRSSWRWGATASSRSDPDPGRILPFRARVVTRAMMEEEAEKAAELEAKNVNPLTFVPQATGGGSLRWGHLEMIRLTINRKMDESRMFAIWRVEQPWKSVTKKGQGHRMGGGKGAIDHYVFPLRAGRIIVEMGGHCEFEEVEQILTQVARILPFRARVVTRAMMEEEAEKAVSWKPRTSTPSPSATAPSTTCWAATSGSVHMTSSGTGSTIRSAEFRSCVKVEVAVLGCPS